MSLGTVVLGLLAVSLMFLGAILVASQWQPDLLPRDFSAYSGQGPITWYGRRGLMAVLLGIGMGVWTLPLSPVLQTLLVIPLLLSLTGLFITDPTPPNALGAAERLKVELPLSALAMLGLVLLVLEHRLGIP
jgi:hypothetical protein